MANGGGEFPIGKVASFGVVLALTFLPVMKCGPIDFVGHEILRNKPPDVEGLTEGLTKGMAGLKPTSASSTKPDRDKLFPPAEQWMWFLYIAILAAAVISFFAPSGNRVRALLGGFGAAALLVFLSRFQTALMADEEGKSSGLDMLEWAAGAYVALIGFGIMLFDGLRSQSGGGRRRRVID